MAPSPLLIAGAFMATYTGLFVLKLSPAAVTALGDKATQVLVGATIKTLPVTLLGVLALLGAGRDATLRFRLGLGLLVCSAGDFLLDAQALDPRLFLAGLVAFLLGHISYIAAFTSTGLVHNPALGAGVLALPAGLVYYLYPFLPADMRIPVVVYASAIGSMGYCALTRRAAGDSESAVTAWHASAAGALLFLVSDAILAVDRFAHPFYNAKLAVMVTYYLAQLAIAASAFGEPVAAAGPAAAVRAKKTK
jgi:uncharacterized membrane protein YhhN